MSARAARRRHPLASLLLLGVALVLTGGVYAAAVPERATASAPSEDDVAAGRALFLANCSTCHGTDGAGRTGAARPDDISGPSLVGVGAASVDFQVSTGRMPLQASGPQAPARGQGEYSEEEVRQLAAWVATLGPGPSIPGEELYDPRGGDPAEGYELFSTNCAMCHNFAGAGGALTSGKYAPDLGESEYVHIYEAMLTGPQAMPVFSDGNIDPEGKQDIIAYLESVRTNPEPGGLTLGSLGPVNEGLVAWVVGLVGLIGCAVWLGSKAS